MVLIILAESIFGFSMLFSKLALSVTTTFVMLSARFCTAFLLLSLLWLLRIIKMDFRNKNIFGLILLGLFQPVLYFIFEAYGIIHSSSSFAGIMIALIPIAATVLSAVFLREKPSSKQIFFIIVSFSGVVISVLSGNNDGSATFLGVILLIGAIISAGAFSILSRKYSSDFTAIERTYVMFALGSVIFTSTALIQHKGAFFNELIDAFKVPDFLWAILYLAILSSIVAFFGVNYSVTYIGVARMTSFSNLTTVISVVAGVLILREPFSYMQLIACILILVGVWGVNRKDSRFKKDGDHDLPT